VARYFEMRVQQANRESADSRSNDLFGGQQIQSYQFWLGNPRRSQRENLCNAICSSNPDAAHLMVQEIVSSAKDYLNVLNLDAEVNGLMAASKYEYELDTRLDTLLLFMRNTGKVFLNLVYVHQLMDLFLDCPNVAWQGGFAFWLRKAMVSIKDNFDPEKDLEWGYSTKRCFGFDREDRIPGKQLPHLYHAWSSPSSQCFTESDRIKVAHMSLQRIEELLAAENIVQAHANSPQSSIGKRGGGAGAGAKSTDSLPLGSGMSGLSADSQSGDSHDADKIAGACEGLGVTIVPAGKVAAGAAVDGANASALTKNSAGSVAVQAPQGSASSGVQGSSQTPDQSSVWAFLAGNRTGARTPATYSLWFVSYHLVNGLCHPAVFTGMTEVLDDPYGTIHDRVNVFGYKAEKVVKVGEWLSIRHREARDGAGQSQLSTGRAVPHTTLATSSSHVTAGNKFAGNNMAIASSTWRRDCKVRKRVR
jgi:hypothetical protein